jgi:hypothetical protein
MSWLCVASSVAENNYCNFLMVAKTCPSIVINFIDRIEFFLILDLLSADKYILGVQVLGITTLTSDLGGWFSSYCE